MQPSSKYMKTGAGSRVAQLVCFAVRVGPSQNACLRSGQYRYKIYGHDIRSRACFAKNVSHPRSHPQFNFPVKLVLRLTVIVEAILLSLIGPGLFSSL